MQDRKGATEVDCVQPGRCMIRVAIPEVGEIAFAPHALVRMSERQIAPGAVCDAVQRNGRKWRAAYSLASGLVEGAEGIRVVLGAVTLILGRFEGEVCIVTLFRGGEG